MALADLPAPAPRPLLWRIPILGAILREWAEGDDEYPLYLMVAVLSLWGIAILTWGLPALYLPAVAFTPVMLGILVAISRG